MAEPFSAKLSFALKALSMSRGALAAELGVNKSMVGRWVSGGAKPSAHNLARLSEHVARRVDGFSALDWERPMSSFAALVGADASIMAGGSPANMLPLTLLDLSRGVTAMRGGAYEGFFRTTRPFFQSPGDFVHDHLMITRDPTGLLRFDMINDGVQVKGWVLLLHNLCFVISEEVTSGTYAFGIFNGVSTVQAAVLDGLILMCTHDSSRTAVATAMIAERIADLTGDRARDDALFAEFGRRPPAAPKGSVPPAVAEHLVRDIGPGQLAIGGDLLLSLSLARSMSRGADV